VDASWGSEPYNRAVHMGCRVVRRGVKPRVAWGQDRSRQGAARRAEFFEMGYRLHAAGISKVGGERSWI
jgi:hypothetical protein